MPAQSGSNILLSYGNQGAQQLGSAVVLNYNATPPVEELVRVVNTTLGNWVRSRAVSKPLDSRHVSVARRDTERAATWVPSQGIRVELGYPWTPPVKCDDSLDNQWGAFGGMGNRLQSGRWATASRRDDRSASLWGTYGEMMNEVHRGLWCGSKPADALIKGVIDRYWGRRYILTPYVRPTTYMANFVVSGVPMTPQVPGIANFLIDLDTSRHIITDGSGNPILFPSAVDSIRLNPWGKAVRKDWDQYIPWTRYSRPMNPGWGIPSPVGGPTTTPQGTIVVPVRSTYIVLNEVKLITVPSGMELPVQTASLSIDNSSWTYGFTATLPGYCLSYVMATQLLSPVELDLLINGESYRVLVERVTRNREFGKTGITISGRGQLAYLSAPYSPVLNFANTTLRTSQQLMEDALTTNGVSLGWTLDWQIPQWDVAANVWSFSGTYIDAALDIANSVDAYLLPDPMAKTIKVLAKYPWLTRIAGSPTTLEETMPWQWNLANPGIVLPASVVTIEGVEWIEKPAYNAVYVSGTSTGVVGHVVRDGTAGDIIAPPRNNPLITHSIAAREAGRSILGDTGRMAMVTLSLPILTEVGTIYPGTLVKYVDGATTMLGVSRSLAISSGKMENLTQTIEVEVH